MQRSTSNADPGSGASGVQVKGRRLDAAGVRRVLLIQLGDIGDVVLSLPCAQALKTHFSGSKVYVAARAKAAELAEDSPWVDGVIPVDTGRRGPAAGLRHHRSFFARLRRLGVDLAVDLRTGHRGAVMAALSGARQRAGFFAYDGGLWRNRVFTHLVLPHAAPGTHVADQYLSLLTALGVERAGPTPALSVPAPKAVRAAGLLRETGVPEDRPVVAVQPFSLWLYKEWGDDRFVGLIRWLMERYRVSVLITGAEADRGRAADICRRCPEGAFNLAGKTAIGLYAAVLSRCRLFVGLDSAGIHMAAAVGVPTVGIFGPTSAVDWAPRGERHRVARPDWPCVPCQQQGCRGSGKSRCLEQLSVETVQEQVRILAERVLEWPP